MNEARNAGDIAAKMIDRWTWWRKALANPAEIGRSLPVHDGDAQVGYYRARSKDGAWEPVAIWVADGGDLVALRNGREVRPDSIWTFCCRHPVTYEQYTDAMAAGRFDDEPPEAPGVGHNSGDLDAFEAMRQELAGEAEMAEDFLKQEVKTAAQADKCAVWAKRIADLSKRADNERKVEKEPHLQASRAVDDRWRDVIDGSKDLSAKLKKHIEPYLIAQRKAEQERVRKAEEEARRQRAEAEAAARAAMEGDEKAAKAARDAQEKAAEAERQAQAKNASAGRTGARVALRTVYVAVITDYDAAYAALKDNPDMKAMVQQLADRACRAKVPLAGVKFEETQKAA